eukprot:scaffold200_cov401-Prasinococcus_capsulatus_cf.AAC.4
MPPKNKNKKFLAKQKELAEAKAKRDAEKAAAEATTNANKKVPHVCSGLRKLAPACVSEALNIRLCVQQRPTAEELGFFIRTCVGICLARFGPDAAERKNLNMDIKVTGITLYAGKQELISSGTLALTYGVKYGLVGRNGVGKSTLLRAISDRTVKIPDFLFVIHVEQEAS